MVEEYPDADVYWNTLGVAYYRAGDYASAAAALNRATAIGGGTAFDDVFLAMAHARLGDLEEARRELTQAMVRAERDYPGHLEVGGTYSRLSLSSPKASRDACRGPLSSLLKPEDRLRNYRKLKTLQTTRKTQMSDTSTIPRALRSWMIGWFNHRIIGVPAALFFHLLGAQ